MPITLTSSFWSDCLQREPCDPQVQPFYYILVCCNVLFDIIVVHNILNYVMVCDIMLECSWFYNITYYNMTMFDTMPHYIVVGCYRVFCKLYCNIVWCYRAQRNTML